MNDFGNFCSAPGRSSGTGDSCGHFGDFAEASSSSVRVANETAAVNAEEANAPTTEECTSFQKHVTAAAAPAAPAEPAEAEAAAKKQAEERAAAAAGAIPRQPLHGGHCPTTSHG